MESEFLSGMNSVIHIMCASIILAVTPQFKF